MKKLPKILNKINTAIPIASLPQVLLKLVEVCKDETQTAKDIARIASLDPAFSLKLLQLSMIGETEKRNLGNLEQAVIKLGQKKNSSFMDKVMEVLPEGGNLNLCLTCGACSSGCPATGLAGMDPRKFLRMAALGLDEEIIKSDWAWMCTMCQRCIYVCPMEIDIPQLIYHARSSWPREERPKGILGSCDMALRNDSCSAMGASPEDFAFVVEDVLEEYREAQPEFKDMQAPIDKKGAYFFLNQNSREPVTEPDELVPLWKILHLVGADWTYGSKGWGGENYCMFLADDESWEHVTRTSAKQADDLGCKIFLNTE